MKVLKKSLLVIMLMLVAVFLPSATKVQAEEIVDKNFPVEVEECDEKLYGVLSEIINKRTLYEKDFIEIEELNLGIETDKITSLYGLNNFRFDNLKVLNIEGNKLTEVTSLQLSSMPNLTTINLSGNNITSIDLAGLTKLENVILSSNKLTTLNVGHLSKEVIDINIANNDFTSINDISLPTGATTIKLNFLSNNITDISEDYLNSTTLKLTGGVQGVKDTSEVKISKSTGLKIYPIQDENISLKILESNGEVIKEITSVENGIESLPIGKYEYAYYLNGELMYDEENLNDKNSYEKVVYKGYPFVIIPDSPTYVYLHKGKTSTTLGKVTGIVKINLTAEEGVDVYYKMGNGDWQKGNEVVCDKGGNYSIDVKSVVVIDGQTYESEITPIYVRTSLNLYIPDILMLVIVLLLTLTVLGVVFPLVGKKFFKKK